MLKIEQNICFLMQKCIRIFGTIISWKIAMLTDELKKNVAAKAVEEIQPGMVVGLGTGSTFQFAIELIAEKLKSGELFNIVGIPSSDRTAREAERLGITLTTFDAKQVIDLTIDGADEVDKELNLIKGGGGALLKEKILVQASKQFIVMVDETKLSKHLGEKFFVPVEVIKFAYKVEENFLKSIGAKTLLRKNRDESLLVTDEGNLIIDAHFGEIENPNQLSRMLEQRAGIVEHGIFPSSLVAKVFCSFNSGEVREILRSK